MIIKVGDRAPEFNLFSSDKQEINLSDYRGKNVLVLFFPLAFTGVCTKELCAVRDELASYQDLGAEILAISVDSFATLAKFKSEQGYQFPLLSDFNRAVSRAYGALYEEYVLGMKGVSKRSAFVINADGIVKYAEVLESAGDLPDFIKIKETLKGITI